MYKYIFYKLYKYSKQTERGSVTGENFIAWIAVVLISMIQSVNLMTLYVVLVHGLNLFSTMDLTVLYPILIMCILYILNYLFFVKNRKFIIIEKHCDNDSNRIKKIKTAFFWIYTIGSFVLMFLALDFFSSNNGLFK